MTIADRMAPSFVSSSLSKPQRGTCVYSRAAAFRIAELLPLIALLLILSMTIKFRTNECHFPFLLYGIHSTTRVLVEVRNFGAPKIVSQTVYSSQNNRARHLPIEGPRNLLHLELEVLSYCRSKLVHVRIHDHGAFSSHIFFRLTPHEFTVFKGSSISRHGLDTGV